MRGEGRTPADRGRVPGGPVDTPCRGQRVFGGSRGGSVCVQRWKQGGRVVEHNGFEPFTLTLPVW